MRPGPIDSIGLWLRDYFDHDDVFVFDGADQPIYSLVGRRQPAPSWLAAAMPDMQAGARLHARPRRQR